jgi:phage-related protein
MAEKVGTIYYDLDLDDTKYTSKSKTAGDTADNFGDRLKNAAGQLAALGAVATVALTQVVGMLDKAVDAAVKQQNALMGLSSVARGTGNSIDAATKAAKDLSADGLMPLGDAASGLKNLLASGMSLDQAIKLMKAFKDSAAFGRQGSLEFGQAIVGATEGIKNGNSALVDNAGVTKNLSNILVEAGYSAQDLSKASTDVGVRMALYNGILGETKNQTGDAAKLADSFGGAQAKLTTQTTNLQVAIGTALQPILTKLMGIISPIIQAVLDWVKANPALATALAITTVVTLALAAAAGLVAAAIGAIMAIGAPIVGIVAGIALAIGVLIGTLVFLETKFGVVSKSMQVIGGFLNGVFTEAWKILKGALDDLVTTLKPVTDALGKVFKAIGDFVQQHAEAFKAVFKGVAIAIGLIVVAPLVIAFGALVAVIKILTAVIGFIIKHFETIKKVVMVVLAVAFAPLIAVVLVIIGVFKALVWIVQQIWTVFSFVFSAIWTVISTVFNAIAAVWNAVLAPVFNAIIFVISSLFQIWVSIWTGIFTVVWTIISTIAQIIAVIFMGVFNWIMNTFLTPLFNFFSMIFNAIWGAISFVLNLIWSGVVWYFTTVWGFISGILNTVLSFVAWVWNGIKNAIINPIAEAVSAVWNRIVGIKNAVVDGVTKAWNWVKDQFNSFVDAGRNLIDGIVRGVSNAKDAVINKVKEICSGALDSVKKFFGIKSPSRVMAQMGDFLMQGLQNGIQRAGDAVVNTATTISERINDGMQSSLQNVADGAHAVVGVYSGMYGQLNAMDMASAGALNGTVSAINSATIDNGGMGIAQPPVVINLDQSGIIARSRSEFRDIMSDGIEAVNEDLRARGYNEIGDGKVKGSSTT